MKFQPFVWLLEAVYLFFIRIAIKEGLKQEVNKKLLQNNFMGWINTEKAYIICGYRPIPLEAIIQSHRDGTSLKPYLRIQLQAGETPVSSAAQLIEAARPS